MKVGVLGTGWVGKAIGTKLVELGHDVMMGSRTGDNPEATAWANEKSSVMLHLMPSFCSCSAASNP